MPNEAPKFPAIDELFFAVCITAIKHTAWKYSDFEKVKFVEGQLAQLKTFADFVKAQTKLAPANEPADEAIKTDGVEIKVPGPNVEVPVNTAGDVPASAPAATSENKPAGWAGAPAPAVEVKPEVPTVPGPAAAEKKKK